MFYEYDKEDMNDKNLLWKKTYDAPESKGLSMLIYQRPLQYKPINLIKQKSTLNGITLKDVLYLDKNLEEFKVPNVKVLKVVERHEDGTPKIVYTRTKVPFMADREVLLEVKQDIVRDGKELIQLKQSVERDDFPITQGVIRMHMFESCQWVEEDGNCHWTQF